MESYNNNTTLKDCIDISKRILNKYIDLYDLEISNLKETYRYEDLINEIKELKEQETKMYKSLDENDLSNILLELLKIYKHNDKEMFYISNKDYEKNIVFERIYKYLKEVEKNIDISKEDNIIMCFDLGQEVVIDTLSGVLSCIETEIKKTTDNNFKNLLIINKYFLLFSEPYLEERNLSNNFIITDNYYVGCKMLAQIHGIDDSVSEKGIQEINESIARFQINKIFTINDNEIDDNLTNYLIRQYILITSLLALTDENKDELKEYLSHITYNLKTNIQNNRNQESIDNLYKIFDDLESKKSSRLELSLMQ